MSRFVAAGNLAESSQRDDDWSRAQREVEESKRRKEEEGLQEGGKSLYEVLQANKAAKQEKYEESIKLKNQFRSLDEDEVDFLDKVLESTREQEASVQKENAEGLEKFRKQRERAEKAMQQTEDQRGNDEENWSTGPRKRKRGRQQDAVPGVKIRKSSSKQDEASGKVKVADQTNSHDLVASNDPKPIREKGGSDEKEQETEHGPPAKPAGLGLEGYDSDE